MQRSPIRVVFAVAVLLGLGTSMAPSTACAVGPDLRSAGGEDSAPEWIAQKCDAVCGLDDPAFLSNPARVEYPSLIELTPEAKKLRDEGIDRRSAAGIQLLQRAADRVRDECETVRLAQGYCSVWKRIRHRDGRFVPDVTNLVSDRIRPPPR